MIQVTKLNAALDVATMLFPFLSRMVAAVEALAPHAPGSTKLDAVMATMQSALTTADTDVSAVNSAVSMAPGLIALAKAQYNAALTTATAAPAATGV